MKAAIDWFFENEEAGIILEDDCHPSQDFFRFQDEMLDRYRKMFDANEGSARVDFAVVSEPGILGVHEFLPNAKTPGPLLEYLSANPKYVKIGRISDPEGKAHIVFSRKPRPGHEGAP